MLCAYPAASHLRKIKKLAVSSIPIKKAALFKFFRQRRIGCDGVDMPIRDNQVFPSIVIKVKKGGSPAKVFGIGRQPGGNGVILKCFLSQIPIKSVGVVHEISLKNIQQTVRRDVARSRSHPCLFASIFVIGEASQDAYFFEIFATLVVVVKTRR